MRIRDVRVGMCHACGQERLCAVIRQDLTDGDDPVLCKGCLAHAIDVLEDEQAIRDRRPTPADDSNPAR